jgi:hypothetical protein
VAPAASRSKTYLAIGFIAAVFVIAVVVGTRRTVARGNVMAADLFDQLKAQDDRLERIECDEAIPIGDSGATFTCTLFASDDAVDVEYTMARDGSMVMTPMVRARPRL